MVAGLGLDTLNLAARGSVIMGSPWLRFHGMGVVKKRRVVKVQVGLRIRLLD